MNWIILLSMILRATGKTAGKPEVNGRKLAACCSLESKIKILKAGVNGLSQSLAFPILAYHTIQS